ncbi:hypothetical protein H5410_054312, partial [Solanum commersonii]
IFSLIHLCCNKILSQKTKKKLCKKKEVAMDGYAKMNAAIAKAEKEELAQEEIDRMPFGQRMNSLMGKSKRGAKASSSGRSTQGTARVLKSSVDTVVKKEDECDSQDNPSNFSSVLMDDKISQSAGKKKVSSPLSDLVHVKVEPVGNNMVETTVKNEMGNFPNSSMVGENCASQTTKSLPPQKQRKTATDSVQAAMEEDAPGLLQVLLEKGVSIDEMKLYGKNESNEPLDDLSSEDNFSELQAVISKVCHTCTHDLSFH